MNTNTAKSAALFTRMLPAAAHAVVAFITKATIAEPDTKSLPEIVPVKISPQLAIWLLEANDGNRHVRIPQVMKIVHDIKHNNWRSNAEAIKFDWFGRLMDGQHRLWAIVESGVTIETLVAFNVNPEAADTMNSGVTDTVQDFARRHDGVAYAERVAAWARTWYMINGSRHPKLTNAQFKEWREKHAVEINWALATCVEGKTSCTATTAPVVGAMMFAHQTNPSMVTEFAKVLISDEGLVAKTPVFVLHNFLYKTLRNHRDTGYHITLKTLQALYHHVRGTSVSYLTGSDQAVAFFAKAHGGLQPLTEAPFQLLNKLTLPKRGGARKRKEAAK